MKGGCSLTLSVGWGVALSCLEVSAVSLSLESQDFQFSNNVFTIFATQTSEIACCASAKLVCWFFAVQMVWMVENQMNHFNQFGRVTRCFDGQGPNREG